MVMRTLSLDRFFLALPLVLVSIAACEDSPSEPSVDAAVDARTDASDAEGPVMCSVTSLCRFTSKEGRLEARMASVPNFCTHQKWPNSASAGLYEVCIVDPQGVAYRMMIGGSVLIDMPGWTHSAYGGVVIPSTLAPAGTALCNQISSSFAFNQCPAPNAGVSDGGADTADAATGG